MSFLKPCQYVVSIIVLWFILSPPNNCYVWLKDGDWAKTEKPGRVRRLLFSLCSWWSPSLLRAVRQLHSYPPPLPADWQMGCKARWSRRRTPGHSLNAMRSSLIYSYLFIKSKEKRMERADKLILKAAVFINCAVCKYDMYWGTLIIQTNKETSTDSIQRTRPGEFHHQHELSPAKCRLSEAEYSPDLQEASGSTRTPLNWLTINHGCLMVTPRYFISSQDRRCSVVCTVIIL